MLNVMIIYMLSTSHSVIVILSLFTIYNHWYNPFKLLFSNTVCTTIVSVKF